MTRASIMPPPRCEGIEFREYEELKMIFGRSRLPVLIFPLLAMPLQAGTVETTKGQAYEGEIHFEAPETVVVHPARGEAVHVPLAEVTRLSRTSRTKHSPESPLSPWLSEDVGRVKLPGKAAFDAGHLRMSGAGWGLEGTRDSFHFIHQPLKGDGQIVARLDTPLGDFGARGALIVRESLSADARSISLALRPHSDARLGSRPWLQGEDSAWLAEPPRWVRLIREEDHFSALSSMDGKTWRLLGERDIDLPDEALWGVGAWTTSNMSLGEMMFSHVQVIDGPAYTTFVPDSPFPSRGVVLVDGTQVAGDELRVTEGRARFMHAGTEQEVSLDQVAMLIFNPVEADVLALAESRSGALLVDGDVFEGELVGLEDGKANMNSVIFGSATFEVERELAAVLFRAVRPRDATYIIATADGTAWRGEKVTFGDNVVIVEGTAWGTRTLPAGEVTGIQRGGNETDNDG